MLERGKKSKNSFRLSSSGSTSSIGLLAAGAEMAAGRGASSTTAVTHSSDWVMRERKNQTGVVVPMVCGVDWCSVPMVCGVDWCSGTYGMRCRLV